MYIIGGVAVVGIGYYLWNKNKKSAEEKPSIDNKNTKDLSTDEVVTKVATDEGATNVATDEDKTKIVKLTKDELNSKLESGCGKKPKLKKNKDKYAKCRSDLTAKLKSQGLVAFDGSYSFVGSDFDQFRDDYVDFSGLNLDL
jgi:hypothetical protein